MSSNFFKPKHPEDPEALAEANIAYSQDKCPGCGAVQSMQFTPDGAMTCGVCSASFTCDMQDPRLPITQCLGVLPVDAEVHQQFLQGNQTFKFTKQAERW